MSTSGPMDYEFEGRVQAEEVYRNFNRGRRGCPALSGPPHLPWNQSDPEWHPEQSHRPLAFPPFHPPPGLTSSPPHWSPASGPLRPTGTSGPRASNTVHVHDAPLPSTPSYINHSLPIVSLPAPISVSAPAPGAASALSPAPAPAPANPPQPPAVSRVSPTPSESRHNHATTVSSGEARPFVPAFSGYSSRPFGRHYPLPGLESGARDRQTTSSSPPAINPTSRVGLPVPTAPAASSADSRSRPRLSARPRIGQVADRDTASSSPGPGVDDDGDLDIGPHLQFFGYLNSARQSQILRGQMPNKRVASRRALASLQQVDLDSLPDSEKTCVICYNDFGVASPEGTVESPVRLPKCKHVFGDKCIHKWLEDNTTCPYCRDKLESELAQPSEQFLQRMLASNGLPYISQSSNVGRMLASIRNEASHLAALGARSQTSARRRYQQEHTPSDASNRDSTARGERRAAPAEDSNEAQRRQRPRHDTLPGSRPTFSYPFISQLRSGPPATPHDPVPLQSPTRESPQRIPAWHQSQQGEPPGPPPPAPQLQPQAPQLQPQAPAFHFPRITENSTFAPSSAQFIMPPLPQPPSPPNANHMPPILPRDEIAYHHMFREGGWYSPSGETASGAMPSSPMEPPFPSFGSNPTTVTPGSSVFMPPLGHASHFHGHISPYGGTPGQPQLHHPDRRSYYMS